MNDEYRPCNETRSCILQARSCVGSCPNGMSLCPTTDICLDTPTEETSPTCDGGNETCLVGQTLYQNLTGNRYCVATTRLPRGQRDCTGVGVVFCELLNGCSNLTAPHLCMYCPSHLVYCNDTEVCVDDSKRCCGVSGYFCDILNTCLLIGDTCELPNIAPEIEQDLILLEEVVVFDSTSIYSSLGHVVGLLLSGDDTPAVDTQGEELGIAVTGVSDINPYLGYWQYSLCSDSSNDSYGYCSEIITEWSDISSAVNNTNALFIPNNARIRFVRKSVEIEGAVWMRVKLWDGNPDGFISSESTLVRNQIPHYNTTIPFSNNSAISELSTLITILYVPISVAPQFSPDAQLTFSTIREEERFVDNSGNTVEELTLSIYLPPPIILSTEHILGFPPPPSDSSIISYQDQVPLDIVDRYFSAVSAVNPIRGAYLDAIMLDQLPGVGLSHDPISNTTGRWQVSSDGSLANWIYLDTIIADYSQYILLDTSARVRFVPAADSFSRASIRIRPWDGIYDDSVVTVNGGFVVVMDNVVPSLISQSFGINEWQTATVNVLQISDRPIAARTVAYLDPIPYLITYKYDKLFTVQIDREFDTVRENRATLENYLQVVLITAVNIVRIAPAQNNRCFISFTVDQDALSLSEIKELLMERNSSLEALGYPILAVSQDASYGRNYGCAGPDPSPYYGVQVNEFVTRFAHDGDEDFLGLAVTTINSSDEGVWQYYRTNITEDSDNSSVLPAGYQPSTIPWVNFPLSISENNAFLLRGIDRLRFVPRPNYYWSNSSDTSLLITIKIWDASINSRSTQSSELDLMNINTNPYEDTLQSVTNPVGMFSLEKVSVYATRYGCDGVVNSAVTFDACCQCGGNGRSCAGCNGVSNAAYDSCDTCQGDDMRCLGCDFIPYSTSTTGECGECISEAEIDREVRESSSFIIVTTADFVDCAGACYGPALIDECSVCSGGNTSHNYNEEKDCAGVCFGSAVIDECGYCTGEGTGLVYNELLDCTGVCGGPFRADNCNICQLPDDSGNIVEHQDCNGVCFGTASQDSCGLCYGGDTNNTADSELDACGVCSGDNSTCIGCDGTVDSGLIVDTCGECGNNDCGCFKINSISPNRGPSTGSTQITVTGAGFFLHDDSLTHYDPQAPNCGAPTSFSTGDIILPRCYFRIGTQQFSTIGLLVNHTTILCTSADTTRSERSPLYNLHIGIHEGPLTPATPNAVFYNDDYSNILIAEMVPTWNILDTRTLLSYVGHNFSDTGFVSCIVYGLQSCLLDSTNTNTMMVYSAASVSSTRVECDLPPVDIPCQTTIRLSFDRQPSGQAIPFAADLDFIFTFYAAAPVVTQAYFTDDMTSVFLQFDKQIELIDTTLSCSNVFSVATVNILGTNPSCVWSSSSFDQIAILLTADAHLTQFTPIEFRNDIIRTSGQLYSRNITDYSVQAGGGTKPVAIIEGPDSVPPCGTVTFNGRQSLYSGYGGFEYTWSVSVLDATTSGFSEIQNYLNGLTPQNDTIVLNTAHFVSDLEYYVQLTVTNSIGLVSDITRRRLIKQASSVPQIQLVGDKMNTLHCGNSILLQVEVNDLPCGSLSGGITYQWSLFEVEKSKRMTPVLQDTSNLRRDSPTLYIPSDQFRCNYTYIAVITATVGSRSNSNNFTIDILPVALRAHIYGGNRTIAHHRSLILDATRSIIIPDAGPVRYIWSCRNANTGEPCYDSTVGNTSVIVFTNTDYLIIPANLFAVDTLYLIQLNMTQGANTASDTVLVQFVNLTPPIVEIVVPSETFVVTERILLEGLVFSTEPTRRVFWQCIELPGHTCVDLNDNSVAELQTTYESLSASTIDSSTDLTQQYIEPDQVNRVKLVLYPNVLIAGFQYTFRLTADNRIGQGYSQITITALPPPTSGNVDIQPATGTSLSTLFTITCTAVSTSELAQPVEYQYGIVTQSTGGVSDLSDGNVQWLTGRLKTEQHITLLPGNNQNVIVNVIVRVSDRYGAYRDLFGTVNVQSASTNYMAVLTGILNRQQADKIWTTTLSSITALLLQNNQINDLPLRTVKRNALSAALDIYENSLVPTKDHLIQFVSLLSYITGDPQVVNNEIDRALAAMNSIITDLVSYEPAMSQNTDIPLSDDGEPVILASGSSPVVQNYMTLTEHEASLIFNVWNDLISAESSTGTQFRNAIDKISLNLCQSKVQGESATTLQSQESQLQILKYLPSGVISLAGDAVLTVSSTIVYYYYGNLCTRTAGCEEVCTMIATTEDDVLAIESATNPNNMVLQLSTNSVNMIANNFMYVDAMEIQAYSMIVSFSLLAPARSQVLEISGLSVPYSVQVPLKSNSAPDGTQLLCLYRQPGDSRWQLDSLTSPETFENGGTTYAVCRYTHLTDFVVALLPAPVTPSPTPSPTPSSTSTRIIPTSTSTSSSIPISTSSLPPAASSGGGGGGGAGGAIAAVVVIILVLGITVAVVIIVFIWRKKRQKQKVGIADPPKDIELRENPELIKAALLTPEEAKVPMQIIKIAEGGQKQRELLGTLNVLPQIRLRELRNQLFDNFESLKNKPFYFLTKQLCDIEPAAEQMQFVNLVYNKTIFIREAEGSTDRSRRHFCTCGLAAQFECSQCTAQGYCSPECQYKHWTEEHSRECRRLAERKRRTNILSRHQTPPGELPVVQPGSLVQQGKRFTLSSIDAPESPASPPKDFRSLLMAQKASRMSLASNRTSLGDIASQSPNTLSRASGIGAARPGGFGIPQQHTDNVFATPKPTSPGQPVAVFDRSSTTKVVNPELLLSSKPLVATTAAPLPTTTAATPQQQGMMRGPGDSSMQTPQPTQPTPVQPRIPSTTSAGSLSQSQPAMMLRHQPSTALSMTSEQLDQSYSSQNLPPTPQTGDGPQAFVRKKLPYQVTPRMMSRMTIQSIVSQDLDASGRYQNVRDEPLLESDEDEYEETSSSSGSEDSDDDDNVSSSRPVSKKPPSLARRSVVASRTERKASTESSSGSEESDSETETESEDGDQSQLVQEKSQKSATPSKAKAEGDTTTASATAVQSTKGKEHDSEENELEESKKLIEDQDDKELTSDEDVSRV